MSKRAEKRALELFPVDMQMCIDNMEEPYEADVNAPRRMYVAYGYEQAEKDLALNIDDLKLLHTLLYAVKNNKQGCFTFTRLSNEQYEEVLRRFKEQRNRQ